MSSVLVSSGYSPVQEGKRVYDRGLPNTLHAEGVEDLAVLQVPAPTTERTQLYRPCPGISAESDGPSCGVWNSRIVLEFVALSKPASQQHHTSGLRVTCALVN